MTLFKDRSKKRSTTNIFVVRSQRVNQPSRIFKFSDFLPWIILKWAEFIILTIKNKKFIFGHVWLTRWLRHQFQNCQNLTLKKREMTNFEATFGRSPNAAKRASQTLICQKFNSDYENTFCFYPNVRQHREKWLFLRTGQKNTLTTNIFVVRSQRFNKRSSLKFKFSIFCHESF